jgi:flagellar protein FliO/FliZ
MASTNTSRLRRFSSAATFPAALASASPALAATSALIEMESYFRVFWGLGIVAAIILILYALLRKRFSLLAASPEKQIAIVEIKPLGGRKSLCLVRVRGQEHLLGLCSDSISHLATLPPQESATFAAALASAGKDQSP